MASRDLSVIGVQMRNFQDLNLDIRYKTDENNSIINDFYIPVLARSKMYKRAVGYFSSTVLIEYIDALEEFITNSGKMKLIISPFINSDDLMALEGSKEDRQFSTNYVLDLIKKEFLDSEVAIISTKILLALIRSSILEIKIAIPANNIGIFHDKIGIFVDNNDNTIAISGSNNETSRAANYNHESFSVFRDWVQGQKDYVELHNHDFDLIWNNFDSNLKIYSLNDAFASNLLIKIDADFDLMELYEEYRKVKRENQKNSETNKYDFDFDSLEIDFEPFDYQKESVSNLLSKRKGIFKFATGAGKTKASILFIISFLKKYKRGFFVIVVPDKTLVEQWAKELGKYHGNVVCVYSDNSSWMSQLKESIEYYLMKLSVFEAIVVTTNSFMGDKFQNQISKLKNNYILIVDECHSVGTELMLSMLPNVEYRLGLSATPEIHGSPELTDRLFHYFNGIIFEYLIEDAIRDKKLVEYFYYPKIVKLSSTEKEEYLELSKKIAKMMASKSKTTDANNNEGLDKLLYKRSRIVYAAQSKLSFLKENILAISKDGYLLIYCGTTSQSEFGLKQIEEVNKLLISLGISCAQYTQSESGGERIEHIDSFKQGTINTLVAIKCLDEGVDIPEIRNAVILASSTNPREFVQRRGRLLRRFPGKEYSIIYDLLVLEEDGGFVSMNRNEINRLIEFGRIAKNKDEILSLIAKLEGKYLYVKQQ